MSRRSVMTGALGLAGALALPAGAETASPFGRRS